MGTKVQSENKTCLLSGYYSMRDLNEDSSNYSPSLFYGDKLLTNGQCYNGYSPSATADASSGCEKDVLKQTMLEHEAIFKYQVYELHRLYRIQRNLMEDIRRKELHRKHYNEGTSFSPGASTSQITIDDRQRWRVPNFPLENSFPTRPSVSGVEYAHLPVVTVEENSMQADPFTSQNRGTLRDIDVPESRPTKLRRKFFDLQLPADEYIDSDESDKPSDEKISGSSAHITDINCEIEPQNSVKFLHRDGDRNKQVDTSRFEQSLRNNGLADLNEPVEMEETNACNGADSVGQSACLRVNGSPSKPVKPKSQFFGLSKESLLNAHRGNDSEFKNNQSSSKNGNGIGWISHIVEAAGNVKDDLRSVSHGFLPEKLSSLPHTIQKLQNKDHDSPSVSLFSQNKVDLWTEKTVCDLEINKSDYEASNKKHIDSIASLHKPSTLPVTSSAARAWSHSVSSYEITSSSCNQKSVSAQIYPCHNITAFSKTTPSNHTNGFFAEGWPSNGNSKPSLAFGFEYPARNGFYHGSSSGSKELAVNLSTMSYDYLKHSDLRGVPEHASNLDLVKYNTSPSFNEMKHAKHVNTCVALSNGSSNKLAPEQGLAFLDREKKHEEPPPALSWLRKGASCKNEAPKDGVSTGGEVSRLQSSSISKKADTNWFFNGTAMHKITTVSCSSDLDGRKTETRDCSSNKKILGFPIFDKAYTSKNESSSLTSISAPNPSEDEVVENGWKIGVLDINLPCDLSVSDLGNQTVRETPIKEVDLDNKDAKFRCEIDLNLSMTDGEASMEPTPSSKLKMRAVIDLETLPVPETEEDVIPEEKGLETPIVSPESYQMDAKQQQHELVMKAAEIIAAISSAIWNNDSEDDANAIVNHSETSVKEPLAWFVDIVCVDNLDKMLDAGLGGKCIEFNEESSSEEIDVFESLTLKQMETKEEDYMPQPLVPENLKLEESGPCLLPTRARRGPARRGRQRRDFQRDILPGLASLSRHEVTEDLQTFGGIMRATGHPWNLGLTRRNTTRGCGRGRRRMTASPSPPAAPEVPSTPLVPQNNVEVGLEDRNLTGWGKTPRRPRRQRCAAGNPQIPLS